MQSLQDRLSELFDERVVLRGDAVQERHAVDWSRENPCRPEVVLRPASTADVATILRLCNEAGQPLVTQGGLTGLAGGATPRPGEWALSLERLNGIVELDRESMTVTVLAGTPLEAVQNAAREAGLVLPLDLGARGSCTIGGNVATNAGGNQVIQYGMTRSLVLGLEAILADGTVVGSRNKLLKNNTGFDLKQLFIGSEGALGVITEVTLRLFPALSSRQSALCAVEDFASVIRLLAAMRQRLPVLSAFEVMWKSYFSRAVGHARRGRDPFDSEYPYYVLLESDGNEPDAHAAQFEAALFAEMESGVIADAVIARSVQDREDFWALRDAVGEILRGLRSEANFDIGVPINRTEDCIAEIESTLHNRFPHLQLMIFGHLGDGNLHLIASTGNPDDQQPIYDMVYTIAGRHGGQIAAEHGIGVLKKPWLALSRSEADIDLMRRLKAALDPGGILNPGRVI